MIIEFLCEIKFLQEIQLVKIESSYLSDDACVK